MAIDQKFTEGHIVALKSGGPGMTVVGSYRMVRVGEVVDYLMKCIWFDGNDQLQRGEFLQSQLDSSEPGHRRHLHFHPAAGHVLKAVGDVVMIESADFEKAS